jgi:hypothetical protein
MKVSPATALAHQGLQADVKAWLVENGWVPMDLTYHNVAEGEFGEILRNRFSPAVLSVRDTPDLLVAKAGEDDAFWLEVKGLDVDRPNMAFEVTGVMKAWVDYWYWGVETLYVLRADGRDVGIWVQEFVHVFEKLMVPEDQKLTMVTLEKVMRLVKDELPWVKILSTRPNEAGSGDPFFLARVSNLVNLPDWKDVVARR